ncbi:MAG: hypothetical protein RL163_568, partial [Pseudomonadota bacterium]
IMQLRSILCTWVLACVAQISQREGMALT